MPSHLPSALDSFTQPHDVEQLRALEAVAKRLTPEDLNEDDVRAIFGLFERFPEEDGYGVFWSFLHALEAAGGYEKALLDSVNRRPAGFNVSMLCRVLNSGAEHLHGTNIVAIITALAARSDISPRAREAAENAISFNGAR